MRRVTTHGQAQQSTQTIPPEQTATQVAAHAATQVATHVATQEATQRATSQTQASTGSRTASGKRANQRASHAHQPDGMGAAPSPPAPQRSRQPSSRPFSRQRYQSEDERRKAAVQRARNTLEQGIGLGPCVFLTLTATRVRSDGTRGRDYQTEPTIRSEVWHLLRTRITRCWPEAQAFTVLEWGKRSGVHLHVVVRDAPGLTVAWMRVALTRRYPAIDLHQVEVYGGHGLTWYLTKTLSHLETWRGWGRYTHPTSQSHRWLPPACSAAGVCGLCLTGSCPKVAPARRSCKAPGGAASQSQNGPTSGA